MEHRPPTPDSPLTNRDSLYDATTTIDDLTQALENVSRVPSPEPPMLFFCCCGRDDCENVQAWLATKARLESRLTLSAEVGQALLQRHEAYVRRHENQQQKRELGMEEQHQERESHAANTAALQDQLDELTKENKALEKRLTQALVNNEVTEVSSKTILQELADSKTTISRLTTSAARSVGWDTRLSAAMKEKDDMQQERDSESQRARLAESRFAALKERTSKLQSEVRRLQNALEERREHRLESSESILMDARKRIEAMNRAIGAPAQEHEPELTSMLGTLVDDNDTLKRDNAELQTLLADAREDYRALQEEMEDQRVNPPPPRSGASTPSHLRQHFHTGSVPTMLSPSYNFKRSSSAERRSSRRYEPMTPETNRRPLSPTDSLANSETKWSSFGRPQLQRRHSVSPSQANTVDEELQDGTLETRAHKPLLLLSRSRGVQTDPIPHTSPIPPPLYPPSHSPSSNASVYSESLAPSNNIGASNPPPTISALIERTTALLHRMQAADALSLTNRLKRQQIRGADVGHLSRTTVAGIIADVGKHLRAGPQEEELRANRRDVRALLAVLREMFGSLGEMRVLLNEVVLNPSSATRISEAVMDPGKVHTTEEQGGGSGPMGWLAAPLSKLFAGAGPAPPRVELERATTASPLAAPRPMPARFVPKLGPALAASATTVNVEFTGTATGRGTTSTFDAGPNPAMALGRPPARSSAPPPSGSGVMGIFAGAPARTRTPDPWVVIPRPKLPHRMPDALQRGGVRPQPNRMSRNVDAVLDGVGTPALREGDGEEPDHVGPLLARTLRRRGLSDSSIHSTFASQAPAEEDREGDGDEVPPLSAGLSRREAAWLENGSVLNALTRRVQSFRGGLSGDRAVSGATIVGGVSGGASLSGSEPGTSPPAPPAPIAAGLSRRASRDSPLKTSSSMSGFNILPVLANLVPSQESAEMARSLREGDSMLSRTYRAPRTPERDYM